MNIFIKKATKAEKYGSTPKQHKMRELSVKLGVEVFYMPYGQEGQGYYYNKN